MISLTLIFVHVLTRIRLSRPAAIQSRSGGNIRKGSLVVTPPARIACQLRPADAVDRLRRVSDHAGPGILSLTVASV
jgi:hypothetical protein